MENKLPLVSVIIPTYNRAKLVCRAIDSALNQTYKNIEIIVVDDGSKDNTREVLAAYGEKIKNLYKENGGESSARNFGIQRAGGEYLAFLDSDDQWHPGKIQKQMQRLLENPDFGIALTGLEFIEEKGHSFTRSFRKRIASDGYILPYILRYPGIGCSTVLAKKEVFAKAGLFDESFPTAADQDWMFRACSKFKALLIDEPLVKNILSNDSTSKSLFTGNRLKALKKMEQYNPEFCRENRGLITKTIAQIKLDYAEDLMWNRHIKEAQKQIREGMAGGLSPRALILYSKSWLMRLLSLVLAEYKDKGVPGEP